MTHQNLLEVKNLKKYFPIKGGLFKHTVGQIKAVEDISFELREGETFGIVGESGSGKSTLGRTIMKLIEPTEGQIFLNDTDITNLSRKKIRAFRKNIQMVFQDPFSSLNPRMTIGQLLEEPLLIHSSLNKEARRKEVDQLLEVVGLSKEVFNRYPHEFSGGQRQRIGIARALANKPKIIIADEPVSALDVSVQSQVINLMMDLQEKFNISYLFIAHDLSVVKHISNRIGVMYLGNMLEIATKDALFSKPLHPYTQSLMSAVPISDPFQRGKQERIILKGDIPSPAKPPSGCVFHTRCPMAKEECKVKKPELRRVDQDHLVACHLV